jgi:hypothetical protein
VRRVPERWTRARRRPVVPRIARPLPVLARARLELLAPHCTRDEAALAVLLATAPTTGAHGADRRSIPLASRAIRKRKHLRCPGARARTTGTRAIAEATARHQTRCQLARPEGFSPPGRPLPDAERCLHLSPSLPAPARPLVLPGGESAKRPGLADRSYEPHLPLTSRATVYPAHRSVPFWPYHSGGCGLAWPASGMSAGTSSSKAGSARIGSRSESFLA